MTSGTPLVFAGFRLDPGNACLWHGEQAIKLKPKAFAVLCYLAAHAGQLVTKDALWQTIWPDVTVSDAVLTVCVRELRQALGDDAKTPRFIETVHRRGYRFIAPAAAAPAPVSSAKFQVSNSRPRPTPNPQPLTPSFVGREPELAQLHILLEKVLRGERQVVFVTGEPGIGKTSLVEVFLARLASRPEHGHEHELWIGRGQCIEHYGSGEAYLPVLEALGRLCREPEGNRLIELLSQQAPTWLVQMPALLNTEEFAVLQRKTQGTTRERMLRELAEAVEVLTAERGLVLWLEDLQWSDVSTLDWLAFVARRRELCRLLVIGTYRLVDVIVQDHPLKTVKQELQVHGQCVDLSLRLLNEEYVAEYLVARFSVGVPDRTPLQRLVRIIHQRTDGNPLFMVNMVEYLVAQGVLVGAHGQWEVRGRVEDVREWVPESLRQLIARQIERLSTVDRRALEVASVAGAEFSAAAVAAGLETEVEEVEERCAALVQREQFLRSTGTAEWPDGTVAARYSFLHALYQEVLYERLPVGRRVNLHRRIGEREEAAYGKQTRAVAAPLAVHFERGREFRKAIHYLQQAGENAMRRSAAHEAISLLTKELELLKRLRDTPERVQHELTQQIALSALLGMTRGFAAPEVEKAYVRARELYQRVEATPQLFPILSGLYAFSSLRAELQTARGLAEQLLTLAQRSQDPALLVRAHYQLGTVLFWLGELAAAREHMERGSAFYDPQHRDVYRAGPDSQAVGLSHVAFLLWFLGYPDQALKRSHEALTLAQELSHPFSLANALNMAAVLHGVCRDVRAVQERAEAAMALSTEQGFAVLLAIGTTLRGWTRAEQGQGEEGIAQMCQGLAAYQATGTEVHRPYFLAFLADAYGEAGQTEKGLTLLAEALAAVNKTEERYYEAEVYRLKGQLTLQSKQVEDKSKTSRRQVKNKSEVTNTLHPTPYTQAEAEAEACFHKAIEIARRQQAKSLELRAVMSLARLWQQQGKKDGARRMLAEIYDWFTEGFDTADLREAKALLEELS